MNKVALTLRKYVPDVLVHGDILQVNNSKVMGKEDL
jgi:hypothetical protein